MKRETAETYRRARSVIVETAAIGAQPKDYETQAMQRAAVRLAEEVIVDLAVRAARRRLRAARRTQ